ncbi:hypothetical protein DBIPINDM_008175 (plasmid) [Mesorhizobium sp. AR02]|uniref:hypothetical protein n=1 Tax=Mesorhizobium sp. AR02 TaxID=2865837 RepID=UPI00215F725B|nr:hypothetical protein [Mesorhizobium sp. AR02]UVK57571.1 hypothetical protein DBIPINDM_008175 [Mesorhizobium sp. AR02]
MPVALLEICINVADLANKKLAWFVAPISRGIMAPIGRQLSIICCRFTRWGMPWKARHLTLP